MSDPGVPLLVPFDDPGPLPPGDEPVSVIHGTAAALTGCIASDGLRAQAPRVGVYVTRTRDVALRAACGRAAVATSDPAHPQAGLLVHATVPASRLRKDPFNPHAEPDQWIVDGSIPVGSITEQEIVEFPELADAGTLNHFKSVCEALAQDDPEGGDTLLPAAQ